MGASNPKYSMKGEENAPTAMCRKRLAKRDSVDYKNTHAVNEHVTPVNSFLKISLSCYVKINVQVKREKLVTCRYTQTTNSPISLSQKND